LNRRKFLKYAAFGTAIAGAFLAGYELDRWRMAAPLPLSTRTVTESVTGPTLTQTIAPTLTQTVTSTETVAAGTLELELFADWHGDGARQNDEPLIKDATLEFDSADGRQTIQADQDGIYKIRNIIAVNRCRLRFGDEFLRQSGYRFISLSNSEFKSIGEGYSFTADPDNLRISLGLTVGPLTLPFLKSARVRGEPYYVDLDLGPAMRDWKGSNRVGHDNHLGIDYDVPEGETIVAPSPGVVIEAEGNWPNVPKDPNLGLWDDGNRVTINHGRVPPYNRDFYTIYCHLKKPVCSVGQRVCRGEKIAESGNTGYRTAGPHLHFQCGGFGPSGRVDPYRDLGSPSSVGYWTKDNDPQFPL
jgi:murein DD-endopeptidase MepM/ murein hydrolase activator NlpD